MSSQHAHDRSETAFKHRRGTGPRLPDDHRRIRPLEWAVLAHVGIFFLWIAWAYGGGDEARRPFLALWGSLSLPLALAAVCEPGARRDGHLRPLAWLWPFVAFNVLTLAATFNPSFRELQFGDEAVLVAETRISSLPSSARPALAREALWFFDAIWLSCFNLTLVVRQRRALRGLFLLVAANVLALSIFGTVQKLGGATGPFFGAAVTRQSYFFASFVYHNHWAAFALLGLAAALGLIWHFGRRREARNFFHTPAFSGLALLCLVATTIPLSGSRSGTLLLALLILGAGAHGLLRLLRRRRQSGASVVPPLLGAAFALLLAAGGTWFVARDMIEKRATLTREQVGAMLAHGDIGSRATLYGDTWRMALDRPWFGWGMASYPHVFTLYNRQTSRDRLPVFYRDAHSDWLQSFAEHGFVGSALLALCALVPLVALRRPASWSPLSGYLLFGCAVLLAYAWIEFPFGNLAVVLTWWLCFFGAVQYARLQLRDAAASPAG